MTATCERPGVVELRTTSERRTSRRGRGVSPAVVEALLVEALQAPDEVRAEWLATIRADREARQKRAAMPA